MRNTLMSGIAVLALPAMIVSAPVFAADEAPAAPSAEAATPPAPQGPFFSRGMVDNMGFPPMGFDPMNPTGAQVPPAIPPGAGQVMNNNAGAGLGGGNDVDIQIRGRIKLKGQGTGNQGVGGNNVWQSMPYGMPYNHGYGAPYGTPFNQGFAMPQGLPQNMQQVMPQVPAMPQAPAAAPVAPAAPAPAAPAAPQAPTAEAAPVEQAPAQAFSWEPKEGMSGPSGFYAQPQMPAAPQAHPQTQVAPVQPQRPAEPEWVKKQRAEAEKRQKAAQERFAEMQKNNPYTQPRAGQSVWGGPHNMNRAYGMPFQHGYGAPYGAPFAGQPYGSAQPQAPAESGGAEK